MFFSIKQNKLFPESVIQVFKILTILCLTKTIKNEPKFTGYKKSAKENEKCCWEYDVKLLTAGDDLQKERQMIGKVKVSAKEEKKIKRSQKIKFQIQFILLLFWKLSTNKCSHDHANSS